MNYLLFGGKNEKKWNTLSHNGLHFPDEYIQHFIPLLYDNKKIVLNKEAEEYASIYVKYLDSEYIKNKNFNKNFWNDWNILINNDNIKKFDLCNFKLIKDYIYKKKEKDKLDKINNVNVNVNDDIHKYAIVDGNKIKITNYKIEPPGLFIGRGNHPKIGHIKKRIYPEDITINIGSGEIIPESIKGHNWKNVINDNTIEWIASWKDNISGKTKYVWLGDKSKSDMKKYDIARKLSKKIKKVRNQINIDLENEDIKYRQLSTCVYLIDLLALRVGNEKNEDEADTFGVSSLHVEHIILKNDNILKLKFLGKDSVEYNNEVKINKIVWNNINEFIKNKNKNNDVFDYINSNDINKYLKSLMNDLTAKVFRTYNASYLFQIELNKIYNKIKSSDFSLNINKILDNIINDINNANILVAKLCNHQKNISKNYKEMLQKIDNKIKELEEEKNEDIKITKLEKIKEKIDKLKKNKKNKQSLKNLSLTTSKTNYIDPRIIFSFVKKINLLIQKSGNNKFLSIEKFMSKNLIEKYIWANNIDENFDF